MIVSARLDNDLEQYRVIFIGGAFGSGKTLLSVALAERLKRRGYRVIANFPCLLNDDITPDMLSGIKKTVLIFDEGGARLLDARSWNSKENKDFLHTIDYCRKNDIYFIIPSATTVDKRARRLSIQANLRGKRFLSTFGLSPFCWPFFAVPEQDIGFSFMLFFPYAYFPLYSTLSIPGIYEDALSIVIQRFQHDVSVDREQSAKRAAEVVEHLESGGVVPGLRSW